MNTYLRGAMPLLAAAALTLTNAPDASAQVAPPLGVIQQFSVLGGSGVSGSAGAGTTVIGDVGSFPNCNVVNFPPSMVVVPFILHGPVVCDGTVPTARADATAAFLALNQGPGTVIPDQLGGQVLGPGVYTFTTTTADIAGGQTLTLTGGAGSIYVFRTGSTLIANITSAINFGAVNPCNVFWQVGSSATINANFGGNIFASASVTIGAGANLNGRAIAGTGSVTMAAGPNTISGCTSAAPPIPPGPGPGPVPALPDVAAVGLLAVLLVSGVFLARR